MDKIKIIYFLVNLILISQSRNRTGAQSSTVHAQTASNRNSIQINSNAMWLLLHVLWRSAVHINYISNFQKPPTPACLHGGGGRG